MVKIEKIARPISNKPHIIDFINGKANIMKNSKDIIKVLSESIGQRTLDEFENLEAARKFIFEYFHRCKLNVEEQIFDVNGQKTSNIIAEIPGRKKKDEIIIIGAHYDTVQGTVGANDNGSGIAAILELARLLHDSKNQRTLRLVAFSLEEPPYFDTSNMGSYIYARSCYKQNEDIKLMVSIDMIAYGGSFVKQRVPLFSMKGKYPNKGNFLVSASLPCYAKLNYIFKKHYNRHSNVPIYEVIAPASLRGINLSDHSSFHKFGYPSLMITDTGFYRSEHYHSENDTIDTLNFRFLTNNIHNLQKTVKDLLNIKKFPSADI